MIKRNGWGIGVTDMPYRKKLCLYIYDESENSMTKVASFNNTHAAELFMEILENQILKGMITEEVKE